MRPIKVLALLGAGAMLLTTGAAWANTTGGADSARANIGGRPSTMVMDTVGRGFLEDGKPDGARYEGRFVIYAMDGGNAPVFGKDVSLFDPACVKAHGAGVQCAHFVALRSGHILQAFGTGDGKDFPGLEAGRTSNAGLRIYYDPHPDGTRNFENHASFLKGQLIATYDAEEYFQIDPQAGVLYTRVSYTLLKSKPFSYLGHTVDLADLAPRMTELSQGHLPSPDPTPQAIPNESPYFSNKGPGQFTKHFGVGGSMLAVG
jgi:hypothetical protein